MEQYLADALWMLLCAGLVFLMQPGFACLESGFTRAKNSINVAIKNLSDFLIASLLYWVAGFGIMFGPSWRGWIGVPAIADPAADEARRASFFLFEMMFCGTATTILSGAVAERIRFAGYLAVSVVVSLVVYPVFGHWAWNGMDRSTAGGWLGQMGFVDFAGSTVVHSVAGWSALATILIIGPRHGRFPPGQPPRVIQGHDIPVAVLGIFLLWFGWLGFNGGSLLSFGPRIPTVIVNTVLAGSAGGLASMSIAWVWLGRADVRAIINGSLAGLVAVTASCHAVVAADAVLIGAVGGIVAFAMHELLEGYRIDDAVGAVPVHLGAGVWGTIAVGLFADGAALGTGLSRLEQCGVQVLGSAAACAWAFAITWILLRMIDFVTPLRVTVEEEEIGLNISEHQARTELLDLYRELDETAASGVISRRITVEPFTDVGLIAERINRVFDALERATKRVQLILDTAAEGIYGIDNAGVITLINPAGAALFGYEVDELVGRSAHGTFHHTAPDGAPLPGADCPIHSALASGAFDRLHELHYWHRSGRHFPVEVTAKPIREEGRITGAVVSFRDITERQHAHARILAATWELARSNEELEQFASVASHDLQEPLRKIISFSELLRKDLGDRLPHKAAEDIRFIVDAATRMQQLIRDLLTLSRVGGGEIRREPIPLDECLDTALEGLSKRLDETGATVRRDPLPVVWGDRTLLTMLLQNLIGNALKFIGEGRPRIEITAERSGNEWVIGVRDNGIGIDPRNQEEVFVAFRRLHSRDEYQGTGIGLAICRKAIERHHGRIWVESDGVGRGCHFRFTLTEPRPE